MENFTVTATDADAARARHTTSDLRAVAQAAARAAGPAVAWGATMLLHALADASAMSLVTPPRDHVR